MPPADTTPPPRAPARDAETGPRHLQVGLLLGRRSVQVASVALAPGRPAQRLATGHDWLAVVTRGDDVVHLSRFADPFQQRSVRLEATGPHHYSEATEAYVVVGVPFGSITDLVRSRVSLLNVRDRSTLRTAEQLIQEYRRRSGRGSGVRTIGFDEITSTRHWAQVGPMLGVDAPPGRFEIFRDKAGQWRWRLRAAGGGLVASSNDGFSTRAEAEAEVTWLRRHAGESPTTSAE